MPPLFWSNYQQGERRSLQHLYSLIFWNAFVGPNPNSEKFKLHSIRCVLLFPFLRSVIALIGRVSFIAKKIPKFLCM